MTLVGRLYKLLYYNTVNMYKKITTHVFILLNVHGGLWDLPTLPTRFIRHRLRVVVLRDLYFVMHT